MYIYICNISSVYCYNCYNLFATAVIQINNDDTLESLYLYLFLESNY